MLNERQKQGKCLTHSIIAFQGLLRLHNSLQTVANAAVRPSLCSFVDHIQRNTQPSFVVVDGFVCVLQQLVDVAETSVSLGFCQSAVSYV